VTTLVGPGLVGSYLGAAAGIAVAVPGPSGRIRAGRVRLPAGESRFAPTLVPLTAVRGPVLVACRAHRTPWAQLPGEVLAAQNGLGHTVPVAVCFLAVDEADGVIAATGPTPRIVLARDPRWAGLAAAWRGAGLTVDEVADVRPAQWEKCILNATVGPLCLATGLRMGAVWREPELRRLVLAATQEGIAAAAAAGVVLADGLVERATVFFAGVGDHRPSVLADPGELPWILDPLRRSGGCPALDRIAALVAGAWTSAAAGGSSRP
jgi:hypothetical protein